MPNLNLQEYFVTQSDGVLPGFRQTEYPVAPVAGSAFTRAIDGIGIRRLLSLIATFTTSAAVANRFLQLDVTDGDTNVIYRSAFLVAVTASLTTTVTAYAGVTPQTTLVNNTALLNVPPFWLGVGEKLRLGAAAIDAADTFTNIRLVWQVIPLGVGGVDQEATA